MVRLRKHDRDDIAMQLIEWAQKDDSINLNAFCGQLLLDPHKISEWAREEESFRSAYRVAKSLLAARRECWLSNETLHSKAYDLNAAVYDHFLHEAKREQAEFEADLKAKQELQPTNTDTIDQENELMLLRAENAKLKAKLDNKSETGSELPGVNASV